MLPTAALASRVLAASVLALFASTTDAAPRTAPRFVEGEVIVKFRTGVTESRMAAAARAGHAGAVVKRAMRDPLTGASDSRLALSRFPRTTSVETMMARLRRNPEVESVEPNYVVALGDPKSGNRHAARTSFTRRAGVDAQGRPQTRQVPASDVRGMAATYPNDPEFLGAGQWGWEWISADIVWPDLKSAEVAVIDTGVDTTHPDLKGLVVNGYDYVDDDSVPNDDNGHGTHVAGIIAARSNNKIGIAGASRSRVYALKVLDASGYGTYFDIAQAIRKAADRASVRVINLSLGGPDWSFTLEDAVDYAVNTKGKLIVAAAGNLEFPGDTLNIPVYPAAFSQVFPEQVMAVAASGQWVQGSLDPLVEIFVPQCRSEFSNFGDFVTITAPGTDILSTQPWKKEFYNNRYLGADPLFTGYEYYTGTSMAAPFVSAVAARVIGNFPTMTSVDVFRRLLFQGYPTILDTAFDVDGDLVDDVARCWEGDYTPPTPAGGPPFLADVNAATALGRGRLTGRLMDASTGLGLTGAVASVRAGKVALGYGGSLATLGVSYFEIVNVPWNEQVQGGPLTAPYALRVSKKGYTAAGGATIESYVGGDPNNPGISIPFFGVETALRQVSIPPLRSSFQFVSDWGGWLADGYTTGVELDQYLFLPQQYPGDPGCTVGFDDYTFVGGCGDPTSVGSLQMYPFARFARDGGLLDGVGAETTRIKRLLPTQAGNQYQFFLTNLGLAAFDADDAGAPAAGPVVRLWRGGVPKATVRFGARTDVIDCTDPLVCDWWHVGSLSSSGAFTATNQLGDLNLLPY
jgi:thermitase